MSKMSRTAFSRESERGVALLTAILGLLLLTLLGLALTYIGNIALGVSTSNRETSQAFYIAQAGMSHASAIILNTPAASFGSVLAAGDGASNTGDELSVQPAGYTGPTFVAIPSAGVSYAGGKYTVKVKDFTNAPPSTNASDQKLVVTVVGTGADGSTATLEASITSSSTMPAIFANGPIINTGQPIARGIYGSVVANGPISSSNKFCVDQYVGSTSTVSPASNVVTGAGCSSAGTVKQSQPSYTTPIILPTTYKSQANYILSSDGNIYNGNNGAHGTKLASGWGGWSYNSGQYEWSNSSPGPISASGTYYFEGTNCKVTNLSSSTAVAVTILADGYINLTSSPTWVPAIPGISMISGNDIVLTNSGSYGTSANPGIVYAWDQVEMTNSPVIFGNLVAANQNNNPAPGGTQLVDLATKGAMNLTNDSAVTDNGGGLGSGPMVATWREVRN